MYVVIMAGGSGTRFWPASRIALPKQLVSVVDGPTMLQRTVQRVLPLRPERVLVITNQLQAAETQRQLADYRHVVAIDVIAEPVGRNTAPAIGLAARIIAAHDPQGTMLVLPADHFIRKEDVLQECIATAIRVAEDGFLVTLGIVPTHPETGYGYIEADLGQLQAGAYAVRRFVEKPDLATALSYLEQEHFFWNSGMFVWRADQILAELAAHMPDLSLRLAALQVPEQSWALNGLEPQIESLYAALPAQSIDYGVMERSARVRVVPADIGWSDVGSWSALPEVVAASEQGHVVVNSAAHIAIESSGCIVSGNGGVVATIGVDDLIVVASGDGLLVCPKDRAQDVRLVVEALKQRGLDRYL